MEIIESTPSQPHTKRQHIQKNPIIAAQITGPITSSLTNNRFYSPIFDEENAFFNQNSKLNNFFTSPYYFNNIQGDNNELKHYYNDDDDTIDVQDSVLPEFGSPLTKEADWYRQYINSKLSSKLRL